MFNRIIVAILLGLVCEVASADTVLDMHCENVNSNSNVRLVQNEDGSATAVVIVYAFPIPGQNKCEGQWVKTNFGSLTNLVCKSTWGIGEAFEVQVEVNGTLIQYYDKNTDQALPCSLK